LRVFAGLPLPESVQRKLEPWLANCRGQYKQGLSLVRPENLHITLYFYGEQRPAEVQALGEQMAHLQAAAIPAALGELDSFPNARRPRVFYIGLKQGQAEVMALYEAYLKLIAPLGYRPEGKAFVPHATFARNKSLSGPVPFPGYEQFVNLPFTFERVVLYESKLKPSGAEYIPLKIVLLK
jgi:2'-5' RNA ligase